ncbi:MAG: sodium/solute symporter [Planctomycetes bacterium]|nr:sodium/solute symporter [Planctomycetota bacterium]
MVGILAVGLLSVRRLTLTGEQYFLAGRTLRWPVVGAALFASNISTIHLVGLAEGGYQHGLVIGNFEWMATFTLILLSLVFVPFYFRTRISTLPEFLERRYGPATRTIMAVMAIAAALLIHIGISLYAGAAIFEEFFGVDVYASILVISIFTAVYTVLGGLKAVVVTETIQAVILLVGAVVVTGLALLALPDAGVSSLADLQAATRPDQLHMLQADNSKGFAWYAILLGYPILGVWYWCSDQTIVQRVLGARDQVQAQRGALFAGALKILPVFLMVLPGVFGYALFRGEVGDDARRILPVMIHRLVPIGLRGLIAAALLAALMSTIAAALNSVGTLVAVDIVGRIRPATSDRAQVRIGRVSAVVVMVLAMAWSTQGGRFDTIFEAINKMPAQFLAPPISTVFVWGVFWRRGTRQAALTTLVAGFALGVVAFLVDLPAFGDVQWITSSERGLGVSFMMQAFWGFCICSAIFVATSLVTPAPPAAQTDDTTWPDPLQVVLHGRLRGVGDPRVLAGLLFALMVVLYAVFR